MVGADLLHLLEHVFKAPGKQASLVPVLGAVVLTSVLIAFALDRVGLSRSCLPIGEDRPIVALQAAVNGLPPDCLEDLFLCRILLAYVIERVILGLLLIPS
jgi:hypothetical protein